MARPTCLFCGAVPTTFNQNNQNTCFRHARSFDLTTRGGSSSSGFNGNKRSIHDLDGYLGDGGFVVSPLKDIKEIDDFAVPHLEGVKGKGKKKAKVGVTQKQKECMICMSKFRVSGVTCEAGQHHSCKGCTRDYITKTLASKGTVYFDRVACMDLNCWSTISAKDAKGVLTKKVLSDFERKEWDMAYLIGGDRDPSSQTLLDKDSRNCPNCNIPITKTQGCSHVVCLCQHEFWYDCKCTNYPFHEEGCSQGYAPARVVGN